MTVVAEAACAMAGGNIAAALGALNPRFVPFGTFCSGDANKESDMSSAVAPSAASSMAFKSDGSSKLKLSSPSALDILDRCQ